MSVDRYWQCDATCRVDCGACKGAGRPADQGLTEALRVHHPIMRSETGPFSGCRCGQVGLGQDVIAHVVGHLRAAFDAAPTPPEITEAAVVEVVARAMEAACTDDATWQTLAAAAVAAYRATDGGAEEAVRQRVTRSIVEGEQHIASGAPLVTLETALAPQANVDYCPQSGADSSTCWCCTTR